MSFPDAVKSYFKRYVDFRGRSSVSEFWWVMLFNVLMSLAVLIATAMVVNTGFGRTETFKMILGFFVIALGAISILPFIALSVRRLHDQNRSGAWFLIGLFPYGLGIITLLIVSLIPGTRGANRFGPNPLTRVVADVFGDSE